MSNGYKTTTNQNTTFTVKNNMNIKIDGSTIANKIDSLFKSWAEQPTELAKLLHTFYLEGVQEGLSKAGIHTTHWTEEDKNKPL